VKEKRKRGRNMKDCKEKEREGGVERKLWTKSMCVCGRERERERDRDRNFPFLIKTGIGERQEMREEIKKRSKIS